MTVAATDTAPELDKLSERDVAALTEYMTVLGDVGREFGAGWVEKPYRGLYRFVRDPRGEGE